MSKSKIASKEQIIEVFGKIIADKATCEMVLSSPSKVFESMGLHVTDAADVDKNLFHFMPELKAYFLAGASGNPHPITFLENENGFACWTCKTVTYTSAGAAIFAARAGFPEDLPLIEALAYLVDLDVAVIIGILESTTSIDDVVLGICEALDEC